MSHSEAVLRVALPCLSFFLLHSLLVTERFKLLALRALGPRLMKGWYRLLYTSVSVLCLAAAIWFILRVPDLYLYSFPRYMGLPMHAVQAASLAFGYLSYRQLRSGEFTGTTQASRFLRGQEPGGDIEGLSGDPLIRKGGYAVVRNPLYLAGILLFAFEPNITRNWLTVSVLSVMYFIWGAYIEEKRMLKRFGSEYRVYMNKVPLLIPRPKAIIGFFRELKG